MNYKQTLEFAKQNNIDILMLKIADELSFYENLDLTDKNFEKACGIIEDIYIRNDIELHYVVQALAEIYETKHRFDYDKIEDLAWEYQENTNEC